MADEVLTPFGQRGSDGAYLTPYARRVATKEKAARDKKKAAQAAQACRPRPPLPHLVGFVVVERRTIPLSARR